MQRTFTIATDERPHARRGAGAGVAWLVLAALLASVLATHTWTAPQARAELVPRVELPDPTDNPTYEMEILEESWHSYEPPGQVAGFSGGEILTTATFTARESTCRDSAESSVYCMRAPSEGSGSGIVWLETPDIHIACEGDWAFGPVDREFHVNYVPRHGGHTAQFVFERPAASAWTNDCDHIDVWGDQAAMSPRLIFAVAEMPAPGQEITEVVRDFWEDGGPFGGDRMTVTIRNLGVPGGPGDPPDPVDPGDPGDPDCLGEAGVRRLSGAGRVETAVAISEATFAPGVPVAYVATAAGFPDALAAGPLAASQGGPILLTDRDVLHDAARAELQRLRPGRIVVLGGEGVVSPQVHTALASLTDGEVARLAGPHRYATAAAIAAQFPAGQPIVFVATGESFPDALAGGARAGAVDAPIVLVGHGDIPAESRQALERLAPTDIVVLGGTGAVSEAVEAQLVGLAEGSVERVSGATRSETSAAISQWFTAPLDTVVLATGSNYPDALAGTPAAVARCAPILLVDEGHIPLPVAAELGRLAPLEIVVLGGPGVISDDLLNRLGAYLR